MCSLTVKSRKPYPISDRSGQKTREILNNKFQTKTAQTSSFSLDHTLWDAHTYRASKGEQRPLPPPPPLPPPLPLGRILYRCSVIVAHVACGGTGVLFRRRSFASSDLILMFSRLRGPNESTRSILSSTVPLIPTARQAGINVNKNNSK